FGMNLVSLLRLLGTRSPLGALLCPALPAVASRCSFPPFSTNRGSSEDITRLNEPMPAIFGRFLWHTARPMCCSRPGMPPLCTPPSAHHGPSQVRSDSYASMLIPSGRICCRYPSRCASLPARPSSDPAAFRRPRSLPCTVLESRSPGAGTL
ncbi:hypothetical protein B0H14DRAFT_2686552, partial [Mycena olivaceomarginata]